MLGPLVFLLVLVPIAELYVIIQVGHVLGVVNTLTLLVLVSCAGAWLMKREGLGALRRARRQVYAGVVPGRELFDGALIALGGALLVVPGFITDAVGLLLLFPPVRAATRAFARRRVARRITHRVYYVSPDYRSPERRRLPEPPPALPPAP